MMQRVVFTVFLLSGFSTDCPSHLVGSPHYPLSVGSALHLEESGCFVQKCSTFIDEIHPFGKVREGIYRIKAQHVDKRDLNNWIELEDGTVFRILRKNSMAGWEVHDPVIVTHLPIEWMEPYSGILGCLYPLGHFELTNLRTHSTADGNYRFPPHSDHPRTRFFHHFDEKSNTVVLNDIFGHLTYWRIGWSLGHDICFRGWEQGQKVMIGLSSERLDRLIFTIMNCEHRDCEGGIPVTSPVPYEDGRVLFRFPNQRGKIHFRLPKS